MKSAAQHNFSQVPKAQLPRSTFNRTHGHKTTFDAGYLIPFYVDEVLPGDTFNCRVTMLVRLATPIVPIMDNMFLDTHFFFVPCRLVWDNWQKFMGEQANPGDSTDYLVPELDFSASVPVATGSLADYFGLPQQYPSSYLKVNALPFRAYHLIWNEWFRDQNLQSSASVYKGDAAQNGDVFSLKRRGKRHDYFTSCLPWPQKGPAVDLPLGTMAPVRGNGPFTLQSASGGAEAATFLYKGNNTSGLQTAQLSYSPPYGGLDSQALYKSGLYADLSQATAATINSLREAFQVQRYFERDARGGTRYIEKLRAHFGVISPDARLQRPEYLGGGETRIHVNPVVQTSGTATGAGGYTPTPQGNLAAYGVTTAVGHGFSKSFVEHGYIIGLVSVRADLNYQQGLNKMWSRRSIFDFYWPVFAHLGEQAVLNKEIFFSSDAFQNDRVFGYQERWAEYRYYPNKITGQFRSSYAQSLDYWHLAQNFVNLPVLGDQFIQENPPVDRIVAVPSEPQFLFDSVIDLKCTRVMPVYSVPGLIDHF